MYQYDTNLFRKLFLVKLFAVIYPRTCMHMEVLSLFSVCSVSGYKLVEKKGIPINSDRL